jgi:predicted DNA-binding protein (UPF0251 family)
MSTHFVSNLKSKNDWVSQAEAARIRGVSRQAIARLVSKKRFQVLRVAGRAFLNRGDVERYTAEAPGRPKK